MPPVAVSEAELKAIHNLPAHRRVKYQAWTLISAGVFSTLMTLGSLATTAYFGEICLLHLFTGLANPFRHQDTMCYYTIALSGGLMASALASRSFPSRLLSS